MSGVLWSLHDSQFCTKSPESFAVSERNAAALRWNRVREPQGGDELGFWELRQGRRKRRCLAGELSTGHLFDAKFSEDGRDLLGRMLALDPRERATAEEAIAHRWFTPAFLAEARRLFGDERGRE